MAIKVIGLDLAKNVFQVHGIDETGRIALKRRLRRTEVLRLFADLQPALVGMEACHTAHYWAREIAALGHEVRLMPPQFVKSQKNDAADAEAICEAVVFKESLKSAFVVNRKIANTAIGRDVVEALAGYAMPVFDAAVSQRVSFAESAARGSTVLEDSPDGLAAREIEALVKELLAIRPVEDAA